MTGDAPLYHYIAWLMSEGQVPYRDIFDFNMPGIFLVHLAVLELGGAGDLAWRLFDLGALTVLLALLYTFCRPAAGRRGAAAAAAIFGLYHLVGGPWMTGQRDFLLCGLLLAAMLALCRAGEGRGAWRWLSAGGLALGLGLTLKPFAALIWLGCAAAAALAATGPLAKRWKAPAWVLAAGAAPLVLMLAWLAAIGGLGPFLSILLDYTLPFYGRLGSGPLGVWGGAGLSVEGWPVLLPIAFLALLGWSTPVARGGGLQRGLTLLGVAYGVAHYALQGKGYLYHLYPLVCFLLALASPALGRADGESEAAGGAPPAGRRPWLETAASLSTRQVSTVVLAAVVLALAFGGVTGRSAFDPTDSYAARGDLLQKELSRLVPPGESVQAMDDTWTNSTLVLLRLGIRQPTPFITDTPLFVDAEDPRIVRLREGFVADLVAAPPAAIVVGKHNMVRRRFDRVDEIPGLAALLESSYGLAVRRDRAYAIWLRQDLAARRATRQPSEPERSRPRPTAPDTPPGPAESP